MQLVNHTPFPALAFAGVDQYARDFHVIVLRQTLTWDETGALCFAEEQAPLCEADEAFAPDEPGALRQESDLCPYKPRCDVIVNANAYPPLLDRTMAPRRFAVRLRVERSDAQLIDKTLSVTGERRFVRRMAPLRLVGALLGLATLGLLRPFGWRLTAPRPIRGPVPVRLSEAFGGQVRIEADTRAAKRVPKRHRLSPEQAQAYPDSPVACDALAANPAGRGFAPQWFLRAMRTKEIPAPRIESPTHPLGSALLNHNRLGRLKAEDAALLVAGLGVRPKSHPDRARCVGTVDAAFVEGDAALPADFDFAVWNAAWPDQQLDALAGDEIIELVNLCAPDTPALARTPNGHGVLRLKLPGNRVQTLVRLATGEVFPHPLQIDTVLVEPETRRLSLVWRTVLARTDDVPVRVLELQTLNAAQAARQQGEIESLSARLDAVLPERDPTEPAHG